MVIVQFEKIYNKGRIQDVVIGRSRTHLLPWAQWVYSYRRKNFLLKNPKGWLKKTTWKPVGEAGTQCHHKPHPRPQHDSPQQGENSKPEASALGVKGVHPTLGTLTFQTCTCTWEMNLLKPMRLMSQDPQDWSHLRNGSEWARVLKPTCSLGPAQRQQIMPSDGGSPAYIKSSAWGKASYLTHTSRSPLEHTPGTETGGCHPCTLPLPYSRAPVSPERELLHVSGAPIFVAAVQGTPLDCLALEARGTCIPGPMGL